MQYVQDLDQKLSKEGIIVGCHSTMLYEALDDDVPIWYLPDTRCVMLSGIIPQSFHCLTLEFCRTQALKDYESLWAPKKNSLPPSHYLAEFDSAQIENLLTNWTAV